MKKCRFCGAKMNDNENFCPDCGVKIEDCEEKTNKVYEGVVVENSSEDNYLLIEAKVDEFEKRAKSAFRMSIISIVLCCCTITSIISFVLSIVLLVDLNKANDDIKSSSRYQKIKNKTISALVISSILVFMGIVNAIDSVINADANAEMYESLINSIMEQLPNE